MYPKVKSLTVRMMMFTELAIAFERSSRLSMKAKFHFPGIVRSNGIYCDISTFNRLVP